MENQMTMERITINKVMEHCELAPEAIIVVNQLNFFLKTDEDRAQFIREYDHRELFRERNKQGLVIGKLAREVGAYHYDTVTLVELESLDHKEALERLFVEPVSDFRLRQVVERAMQLGVTVIEYMKKLYFDKMQNPKHRFHDALIYA